ncbi:MAG: acetyl-CoA decarbonylase/synthase complex subunit gamma [Synergistaceae bacterium]|jgi:acetyl-CoA decarbonylase/synthase complex subunit gamma|nr:acetyl-CoA decarbonylase/synthase complex subunit gamma [Synergistaceae bacterium]
MALTGLQIQKLLPKTNCKECGSNTCLAFAMKLAGKKAELSECPYASEEAKAILGAASEPPVKTVMVGKDTKVGGELHLYRHEKTFFNQPILAVNVGDTDEALKEKVDQIKNYVLERVGEILTIGAIAVTQMQDDSAKYLDAVKTAAESGRPLILRAKNAATAKEAAALIKENGGIIVNSVKENALELAEAAKENGLVLGVTGTTLDEIAEITAKVKEGGFNDILLGIPADSLAQRFQLNTVARRAALGNIKAMGYSFLHFIEDDDIYSVLREATNEVCKYGGVIVFPKLDVALISTIMTLRQNIYTDPQKPIQMEPGIYKIGEPNENSYVWVTTNFSLTYFLVSGEIEGCGQNAWLLLPECEGLSVLTAWAAGKFGGDMIAKFLISQGLDDTQKNKSLIIPGYVAQIKGDIEEGLPGWNIIVGSQEAGDIESFVNATLSK